MTDDFERLYQLVFFAVAVALVLLERIRALQRQPVAIARRWTSNIGLFLIGSAVSAVVLPIGIYAFAQHQPPGVLARLQLPFAIQLLLAFLFLDFWRYWEHRLFHRLPLFWRFHLVHHSDTQLDVTTSERHHPFESVLGIAILVALVAALGLPASALGLYLLTATAVALYSHANLRLAPSLERALSRLIVTAPVHAVHHSDMQAQTDSNYGSVLTVWDRLFGTYVDPHTATIAHFGLGYFHRPQDTSLVRVLQQPFLYRRDLVYPARDSTPHASTVASTRAPASAFAMTKPVRDALVSGTAGFVLVILVMWPTLLDMTASWRSEPYQYAWLVMPMIVYLLGWHHAPGPGVTPRPDFTGVLVVIVAAACWGASTLMNVDIGRQFSLVLSLHGVAMSALGWRCYGRLFPTLALTFLMIPCGDILQPALRVLTLESIDLFARLADLPHRVDGFIIFIGTHRYVVLDECSGLSYVTLSAFLGYCFGLLLYRSLFKVAVMAALGAALGIVTNVLRVNLIVLVDWIRGSQMDLTAHGTLQWVALLITLGFMFYVLSRLKLDAPAVTSSTVAPGPAHPIRRFAPVLAGLSGLLIAGTAAALPMNEPRLPRAGQPIAFPQDISGWLLASPQALWTADKQGRTESIRLRYEHDGRNFQVLIIETLSPTAKLPESALAPGERALWREKQVREPVGCVGSACMTLLHSTWQRDHGEQLRHAYFAYSIGNFITHSRLALRASHGWHRLTGGRENPRLIALLAEAPAPDIAEVSTAFERVQSALNGEP